MGQAVSDLQKQLGTELQLESSTLQKRKCDTYGMARLDLIARCARIWRQSSNERTGQKKKKIDVQQRNTAVDENIRSKI